MKRNLITYLVMMGILIVLNVANLYAVFFEGNSTLSDEGGFIETSAAFAFIFSSLLLLFQSIDLHGFERRMTQFFGVTCAVLFLREVDVEDLNVPYVIELFGSGTGRDILFVLYYISFGVMVLLKDRAGIISKLVSYLRSPVSLTVLAGCLCFVVGYTSEQMEWVLAEEIMEMNGALCIMLAAIVHMKEPICIEESAS